jgi:hypothetical protein
MDLLQSVDSVWWLIGSYLLLVFVLPAALSVAVSYRGLPVGVSCPRCNGDTLQLLSLALRRVSRFLPGTVQRRWCLSCGWEGTVRVSPRLLRRRGQESRLQPPTPAAEAGTREPARGAPLHSEPARTTTQTLDVRSLTLNGTAWRVMLQCWSSTGQFYGRFVFVAPTGRLWLDPVQAFTGTSENEVLGQALALPDGLLARRLHRLVSDR